MIPGSANPLLLASAAGSPAPSYQIERSLRFNSSDSAYLSRTPSVAGNRKTWTWAGWAKRGTLTDGALFHAPTTTSGTAHTWCNFSGDTLQIYDFTGSSYNFRRQTTQVFRDPSGWYHLVFSIDSDNATAANRARIYVNGTEVTTWAVTSTAAAGFSTAWNNNITHQISSQSQYFNGYLADVHFIDGQALDPTSFGEFDANGVWQPKAYTGTYPGNSFHLDFADNSAATAAGIGKDVSGNGNDWTPVNLSVAAGAGNDSLVDTPTSYGTDTGAGGEVRGNYATWNALYKLPTTYTPMTLSNGNLDVVSPNASGVAGCPCVLSTFAASSGKYFFEINVATAGNMLIGIAQASYIPTNEGGIGAGALSYYVNGSVFNSSNSSTAYGASYTSGDVIGVAFDADAKTCTFYKNGSSQGQLSWTFGAPVTPLIGDYGGVSTCSASANFGQRPFAYTAPSGYKALCTTNLPDPVVAKPSEVMDVALYTGDGVSGRTISGLSLSPDLVWIKSRNNGTYVHELFDTVRGAGYRLVSNLTNPEAYNANYLQQFNSDGFQLGSGASENALNEPYVAWTWDAGSSTVTNTQGSITSQVRANPSAGFSVVTYTGTGANATVGHGLNAAPGLIIVKCRNVARNWNIYSAALGADKYLQFTTTAAVTDNTVWNNTPPASTVFSVGTSIGVNGSTETHVAYCFAPVAGYSAFGSYTGNGSADGPAVFTSMRLRFLLIKRTDSAANWLMYDSERDSFNSVKAQLYPNSSSAENPGNDLDFLSNGFKLRTTNTALNASAGTYIYCAFAEHPFQYARAR